jgi:hypothetical protein
VDKGLRTLLILSGIAVAGVLVYNIFLKKVKTEVTKAKDEVKGTIDKIGDTIKGAVGSIGAALGLGGAAAGLKAGAAAGAGVGAAAKASAGSGAAGAGASAGAIITSVAFIGTFLFGLGSFLGLYGKKDWDKLTADEQKDAAARIAKSMPLRRS